MKKVDYINKALELHKSGDLFQAKKLYQKILNTDPKNNIALTLFANLLIQENNINLAINLLSESLEIDPQNCFTNANMGFALFKIEKFNESLVFYDQALLADKNNSDFLCKKANSLYALKRYDEAIFCYSQALHFSPNSSEALINLGKSYRLVKKYEKAINCFNQILKTNPSHEESILNIGLTLSSNKLYDQAAIFFERLLKNDTNNVEALFGLAVCKSKMLLFSDAEKIYDKLLEINPNDNDTRLNKAVIQKNRGDYNGALKNLYLILDKNPHDFGALFNISIIKLSFGEFNEGWKLYENRWQSSLINDTRSFNKPLWLGSTSIKNKKILIFAEQGFGDFIQMYRYEYMLCKIAKHVYIEVPKQLFPLINSSSPNCSLIIAGEIPLDFDYVCPIMSLPLTFKTTIETIPNNIPYIFSNKDRNLIWQKRIKNSNRKKIGISWKGSPEHEEDYKRSIDISLLNDLFDVDYDFFILQKEISAIEEKFLFSKKNIFNFSDEIKDFADTASIIEQMDFVISVDTSIVHLAGAMNKKTFLLLPFIADYRWLINIENSPWYSSLTLIRQSSLGDWFSVINKIMSKL